MMQWSRSKITRWKSTTGFMIVECPEQPQGRGYRLETRNPDDLPIYLSTLDAAKTHAAMLNELQLLREHNEQLRAELDERRQAEAFERDAIAEQARREGHWSDEEDDGRGIPPIERPEVKEAAAKLIEVMAENSRAERLAIHQGV
jgi:hypothetical protein